MGMKLESLELQNPWWKGAIEQDFHLQKLRRRHYQYHPVILPLAELRAEDSGIYTLIGPRQVGKTTYLKLLIKELLQYHSPYSLFYFSCENLSKEDLREIIRIYLEKVPADKHFVFLDEISLVEGWELIELELYNQGHLRNTIIINSGSSSLNLKKSAERLPGRKNKGKLYYYFPLSFREFVVLIDKNSTALIKNPYAHISTLQHHFQDYIKASGFPSLINQYYDGTMNDLSYDLYKDWIEGEIAKVGRSTLYAYQIFTRIVESLTSQVNWESIAKNTSIKSHTTVAEYVDLFDSLFITKVVPMMGSDMKVSYAKNKKIYFYDHFLFSVLEKNILKILHYQEYFHHKIKNDDQYLSRIVENIVFSNLLKHVITKGYDINNTLFFWRNKTQQEVDFIIRVRKGIQKIMVPIEVKYRNKVELNTIKTFKPFILSKDTYDEKHLIYPVSLFLFMLEEQVKL